MVDPLPAAAKDAIESIISHYCQDVHLESAEHDTRTLSPSHRGTSRAEGEEGVQHSTTSKVVTHWTEALHSIDSSGSNDNDAGAYVASIVLGLYPRLVRQKIVIRRNSFRSNRNGEAADDGTSREKIAVGKHGHLISRHYFGLIRDLWTKYIPNDDHHTSRSTPRPSPPATDLDGESDALCLSIVALAEDVVSLTAASSIITTDEEKIVPSSILEADQIRKDTLPYLLNIMCLGFELLHRRLGPTRSGDAEVFRDAVLAATIAAASFTMGDDDDSNKKGVVDPLSLHPDLSSKLSLSRALEHTLSDPVNDENGETSASTFKDCLGNTLDYCSPLLSQCIVDLPSRAVPAPWVRGGEHMEETALSYVETSANEVLDAILSTISVKEEESEKNVLTNQSPLARILHTLGDQVVSDAVRCHFFGRSFVSTSTSASLATLSVVESPISSPSDTVTESIIARNESRNQLPWPTSLSSTQKSASGRNKATLLPECRAHVKIPSRLCSMLRLCTAFTVGCVSGSSKAKSASNSVLENFLPVVYCLVDSIDAIEQAIGGAALLALLNAYEPKHWKVGFADTASDVVVLALKTSCSDSIALSVLCRARYELEMMHQGLLETTLSGGEKAGRLRRIGIAVFEAVHKASYRSGIKGEDDVGKVNTQQAYALSALLGGAHPVLSELADMPDEIAASVELIRPGLAVLLPIIGWDMPQMKVSSRQLQLTALACLEELMIGGHPVVPRHTGKIMSELVGCICRAKKDIDLMKRIDRGGDCKVQIEAASAVASLGLRTAHVAKILCGERAKTMLRQLIEDGGYNSQLTGVVAGLL